MTTNQAKKVTIEVTGWELETMFHMASNASMQASSPFFEKYRELASKVINARALYFPDYLDQYKVKTPEVN
jgi:hypothetical protein